MERQTSDKTLLDTFLNDVVSVIAKHAQYIVVSGFVAIAHGRSRATEDIDMIIGRLDKQRFAALHGDMVAAGFECEQSPDPGEIYSYLSQNTSIRYVKKGVFLPVLEVKFAKDELDEYQLRNRTKLPLTGLDVWFSTIETNIAFKEELLKSPKDLEDAEHLRNVFRGDLNTKEITRIKQDIRRLRL